jgi:putative addiction module component (TIGR02574 family)
VPAKLPVDTPSLEKNMHPAMNQLSQLPASERLDLVQDLWDSISETRDELSIQKWHRELIKARLADFDDHEVELGISREQVWQQVDDRRGS